MFGFGTCYLTCYGSFRLLALIQPHGWDPVSYDANKQLGWLLANASGRDCTTCKRSCTQQCGLKWGSRSVVGGLWNASNHSVVSSYCNHLCYAALQKRGTDKLDKKSQVPHEKWPSHYWVIMLLVHASHQVQLAQDSLSIRIYKKDDSWELNITSTLSGQG